MNTKNITAFLMAAVLIAGSVFFAGCEKEKEGNKIGLQKFTIAVPDELMQEPVIEEMLAQLANIPIQVNERGIMEFESSEDANAVVDLLQEYQDLFDDEVDSAMEKIYPRDAALCAFEEAYEFRSLRRDIEEQLLYLEGYNGISKDYDPDDHPVASPFMRAIFNPNSTILIDGMLCVQYANGAVGIMRHNYEMLNHLLETADPASLSDMPAAVIQLCAEQPDVIIMPFDHSSEADFTYTYSDNGTRFTNHSFSTIHCNQLTCQWDFGDGATSTLMNPTHVYDDNVEEVEVSLSILLNGEIQDTRSSVVYPKTTCPSSFSYDRVSQTQYVFHPSPMAVTGYEWYVDGVKKHSEIFPYSGDFTYNFPGIGRYTVMLKTSCSDGSTGSTSHVISIEEECGKRNDREKIKSSPYSYGGSSYRVKSVLRVTNWCGFHRICSRIVHYKSNSNGNWVEKKTPVQGIGVGFGGYIYYTGQDKNDCIQAYPDVPQKYKAKQKSRISLDQGIGYDFKVEEDAIYGYYTVKSQSPNQIQPGITLL